MKNKTIAIVTGASSGMGRLFAKNVNKAWPDIEEVWLIGRNVDRLNSVARSINIKTKVFPIDLTDSSKYVYVSNELLEYKPNVKVLVNSAGLGYTGLFENMCEEDVRTMVKLNCEALTAFTSICLKYMHRGAHIINMASAAAFIPQPEFAVYAASKSYVLSLSDALGREFKNKGIIVTAVCPGAVDTPFFATATKYGKIKEFKKYFMSQDSKVVHKALIDAKNNKSRSIYGLSMKAFQIFCKIVPHSIILRFM